MRPLLFLTISACAGSGPDPDSPRPDSDPVLQPNLLIFVADDLGIDKLARYGFHPNTPSTPTIDGLIDSGVRFTRVWAESVCSPARAAMMTGLPPHITGIGAALTGNNAAPLADDTVTLPELLPDYSSSLVGKWHLSSQSLGDGFWTHPNDSGWEWYAGMIHSIEASVAFDVQPQDYFDWERTENGIPARDDRYITTANADDAIARIDAMPEPWLLVVMFYAPHAPHHRPPDDLHSGGAGLTDTDKYNLAIEAMDTEMGRVLASIPADVSGRTTVFFTGDNGTPPDVISPPAVWSKGTLYEGGIRVPLVVSGYGVTRVGECTSLVQLSDFPATMADLAGVSADSTTDSVSFASCLTEAIPADRRAMAVAEGFNPAGFGPYASFGAAARDDRYKLIVTNADPPAFFDLGDAPTEGDDRMVLGLSVDEQIAYDALWEAIPQILRPAR